LQRTSKGHRLYSSGNVEQIRQILGLLEQGISIGQVKPLLDRPRAAAAVGPLAVRDEVWRNYQQIILIAIETFDGYALDHAYKDVLPLYPVDIVSQRLTAALLRILVGAGMIPLPELRRSTFFGLSA
jgi:DNA-binding transcriptional MerR regulator